MSFTQNLNLNLNQQTQNQTLYQIFSTIKDKRQPTGKRHKLAVVLTIDLLAQISGYKGILAKYEFIKNHKQELKTLFAQELFIGSFPSPNTFTRVKEKIDFDELNLALFEYFKSNGFLKNFDQLHLDGKAIRSTVKTTEKTRNQTEITKETTKETTSKQTFDAIVTAFTGEFAILSKSYQNQKTSEITVFEELIKVLGVLEIKDKVITGDALHCQKKP